MATYPIRTRRWTRAEYDRLIAGGAFHPDERLELLDGHLVVREPQGSRHAVGVELALRCLQRACGPAWRVRVQLPLALDSNSEPEPDLSVVPGDPRDSSAAHPTDSVLVIEVADTSLAFDREHQGGLYARAGVADYWIVNLVDRQLEVHREPQAAPLLPCGRRYGQCQVLGAEEFVCALAAPFARIAVADLLP